jgi:TolB-like protein
MATMRISAAIISMFLTAVASAASPATRPTVLLTRFAQLSETAGTEWIGRSVQESLLTDVSRLDEFRVISDQHPPTTDLATARQLGRDAGADLVVIGGYQQIGNDLRITGQVVDVGSGEVAGTLKSTATENELIAMEDSIAGQLGRALNRKRQDEVPQAAVAKVEIETLGAVRMVNYSRPFLQSSGDRNSYYTNRHTYGQPAWSPYFDYTGCGYFGYGYPGGFGCGNFSFVTPRDSLPW